MSSFLNGMEIEMIHVLCRPVFGGIMDLFPTTLFSGSQQNLEDS